MASRIASQEKKNFNNLPVEKRTTVFLAGSLVAVVVAGAHRRKRYHQLCSQSFNMRAQRGTLSSAP